MEKAEAGWGKPNVPDMEVKKHYDLAAKSFQEAERLKSELKF